MADIFDKLQFQLKAGCPVAVYRKPGEDTLNGIFQNDNFTYYNNDYSGSGFVFAPFSGGKNLFIPEDKSEIVRQSVSKFNIPHETSKQWPVFDTDKITFENIVGKAVAAIHNKEFEKVVLSRKEIIETDVDIVSTYNKLIQAYPAAFVYCFYHKETGLWMGATPEQLLKAEDNIIYTVALAGTQVYNDNTEAVWQSKEQKEQQIVTDYIIKSITDYISHIKITSPYTFRAGNLVHIKTNISGTLKQNHTVKEIINTLHPTPAVCGMPKGEAIKFILENENYSREYYSGFLGEINFDISDSTNKKTDLFVNLRCMKVNHNEVNLFIGCGITAESNPKSEFTETVNKSNTIKGVL